MKISTEIDSFAKFIGEHRAVEEVAKAGFDAWDFSMFCMGYKTFPTHPLVGENYIAYARELRKIGEDNGIHCNQSHAPFPCVDKHIRSLLKRAIECTAEAGGKICIVHPCNNLSAEENAEMYFELLPFAKSVGVKIAAENMWNWDREKDQACAAACSDEESFLKHLNIVNDEYLVACLDIGHAEMRGLNTSAVKMIRALGEKLQALHIHDNDKWHDSHQIPYSMDIDFKQIIRALKDVGYSGYFTLEAQSYIKREEDVSKGLKELAAVVRNMADEFEAI